MQEGRKAEGPEGSKVEGRKAEGRKAALALMHLCDSSFPIGAFAYSDGLETATATGAVATAIDLRAWIEVCLDETLGRMEGPAVWQAWPAFRDGDWQTLVALDEELHALRPSSSARRSSRAMGRRLLTTWQALYPDPRLEAVPCRRRDRHGTCALSMFWYAVATIPFIGRSRPLPTSPSVR